MRPWTPLACALAFAACASRARAAEGLDTLSAQVITLAPMEKPYLLRALAAAPAGSDSLPERAAAIVLGALGAVEASCRSGLMDKNAEPGSPWIAWRNLGRVARDSCAWYVGAVSCIDSLCGALVPHDRLALLCVGRSAPRVILFPGVPASIGEEGVVRVDSATIHSAADHVVIQARRVETSDHPCYGGPEFRSSQRAEFVVLRGERVTHAFALGVASESVSNDDVDGDSGTTVTSSLVASAARVGLDRRTDDWLATPDGDPKQTKHTIRTAKLQLEYDARAGRFVAR